MNERPAILVTRRDDTFSSALRDAGFETINLELIRTRPAADLASVKTELARLSEYDGLFFTSPVAAEIFVDQRQGANGFYGKVYALGTRAQEILTANGLDVFHNEADTAAELVVAIPDDDLSGKRFLFVRGEKSLDVLRKMLDGRAVLDEVIVYETIPARLDRDEVARLSDLIESGQVGCVCFFSPSAVETFCDVFGDAARSLKAEVIGETTAAAARQFGFSVDLVSPRSTAAGFSQSLIRHLNGSS